MGDFEVVKLGWCHEIKVCSEWLVFESEGVREVYCGVFGQGKVEVEIPLWCGVAGVAELDSAQLCGREFGVGVAVCSDALGWCVEEEVLGAVGDLAHALLTALDARDVATHGACPRADADSKKGKARGGEHCERRDQGLHSTLLLCAAVTAVAVAAAAAAVVVIEPRVVIRARGE